MIRTTTRLIAGLCFLTLLSTPAMAQDDDRALRPAEPDFTLLSLPTSLPLPQRGASFRITHRFTRSLLQGSFSDVASDAFGLDNGATTGLELRYGVIPRLYLGVRRTGAGKIVDFFGQYGVTRQNDSMPLEMSVQVGIEGRDNFQEEYSPTVALVATRMFGERGAIHVIPAFVGNSQPGSDEGDDSTFLLGLGARVALTSTLSLVGEAAPRVSGFDPGIHHGGVGIEKRLGGHVFQIHFANSFGSTLGQVARGGFKIFDDGEEEMPWYLGFSITRKFF